MRATRRAIFRSSTPRCMSQSTKFDSAAESFHTRTTAAASRTARLGRSGARTACDFWDVVLVRNDGGEIDVPLVPKPRGAVKPHAGSVLGQVAADELSRGHLAVAGLCDELPAIPAGTEDTLLQNTTSLRPMAVPARFWSVL